MSAPFKLTRIPSLKTVDAFRAHVASLGIEIPCEDEIAGSDSPIGQPLTALTVNGKTLGNRIALLPMEGWDGTTDGGVTDPMRRRWRRFGESGAKLICGAEAMAVRPDGRANPNQLIIHEANQAGVVALRALLLPACAPDPSSPAAPPAATTADTATPDTAAIRPDNITWPVFRLNGHVHDLTNDSLQLFFCNLHD